MSKLRLRWVLLAVLIQSIALTVLVASWWPEGPSLQDLDNLGDDYEVVDAGEIQCGNGGTHECDWKFTVAHDESESALRKELKRVGLDVRRIESDSSGQSVVLLSWIVSDPSQKSGFTALALAFGLFTTLMVALELVVRRVKAGDRKHMSSLPLSRTIHHPEAVESKTDFI